MAALRGPEIAELQTALLSAFKRSSLVVMVRTQLNADLDTIAGGDTFDIVVFELIAWAEKHGRTEDLIQGAYACNPQNPQLQQNDPGQCLFEKVVEPGFGNLEAELVVQCLRGRDDEPFRLRPEFEPPLVSEAGLFAVKLLDANGRDVGLPRSLHRGVTLPKT